MSSKAAAQRSTPTKRSDNSQRPQPIQRQALAGSSAPNPAEMQKRLGNQGTQKWLADRSIVGHVQQPTEPSVRVAQPAERPFVSSPEPPITAASPYAIDSTGLSPASLSSLAGSQFPLTATRRTDETGSAVTADTGAGAIAPQQPMIGVDSTVTIQDAVRNAEQTREPPKPDIVPSVPARPLTEQVPLVPETPASAEAEIVTLPSLTAFPGGAVAAAPQAPLEGAGAAAMPDIPSVSAATPLGGSIPPSAGEAKAGELTVSSGMILPTVTIPVPVAESAGAQLILDEISSAAATSREMVVDRIAEGLEAIAANVREQQQSLMAAGEGQAEAIRGIFANARDQVTQFVSNAQSQLQADAAIQQAALDQGHAALLTQADATFVSRQERAQELGNTYSARAIDTANEAAQQVQSQIQGYAQEARNIGQTKVRAGGATPEIAQTKAQVANELATDTATKVTGGMSDAMAQLSSTGPPTADAIREQGQEAARQLGAGQTQVVDQLINTNQQATNAIEQTITAGNQASANLESQLLEQLSTLENSLLIQLQTQVSQKSQEIDAAGQQTITTFQEQGQQALAAGDNNLTQLNEHIAGMNIDPAIAPEAARDMVGQISGAYDSLIITADNAFQQVDSSLSQAGTDVIGQIEALSGSVAGQVTSFLTQAQSKVSQQSTAIGTQLADTVTHTTTAGNGMVNQVGGSLDGQLSQLDQGFAQGLGDYRNHLNGQVISAANQAREPVSTLPSRTDRAQSRAETQAQQGFWERQWNDFKEMVSDPGFLVGLLVGFVLAVVVIALIVAGTLTGGLAIVAAFAVVGAIAAAVGSVVSQATNGSYSGGWEWSRVSGWKVLEAAAIGAVFGAVLTGAALIMGPALAGSLWGIVILSVTAGVLTVLTNVFTGQRWDKGLVANMLFVGVLAGLGKYIPIPRGRGGVAPKPVPPEPVPPEPVPPEPVPPKPPIPGGNRVPLNKVRYSQKSVKNTTSDGRTIDQVAEEMRTNGWDDTKPQPDMIDWGDGELQTLDHRRLVAANRAKLEAVGRNIHPANELIPADQAARFPLRRAFTDPETGKSYTKGQFPKTWGEAALFRSANQGKNFPIRGSHELPKVTGGSEE